MTLSRPQLDALRWLDSFPNTRARWMRNGKEAYGDASKWDTMELSGKRGSIRIAAEDWKDLCNYIAIVPAPDRQYGANEAGIALLAEQVA